MLCCSTSQLLLAVGAEVGPASGQGDALDGCSADGAGLAGTHVDTVFELEKTTDSIGIDVIGYGRAAQLDGVLQDFDECGTKTDELSASKAPGLPARTDSSTEEALVGIDVAYSVEKRLVEQCSFDGGLAIAEEGDKIVERYGKRLPAGAFVNGIRNGEAAKPAWIDKTQFAAAAESDDSVSVRGDWSIRGGDEEAPRHAQMDKELRGFAIAGQVDDDGLADAMNAIDTAASKGFDDLVRRGFEGLGLIAGPDGADGLTMRTVVDSVGYGLYFRKLGHDFCSIGQASI